MKTNAVFMKKEQLQIILLQIPPETNQNNKLVFSYNKKKSCILSI